MPTFSYPPGGGSLSSPLTTTGDLFGFAGTNARVPVGGDGNALTADSTQSLGVSYRRQATKANYLINGGFDYAQRQAPGTATTIATDTYSADRWRLSTAGTVSYQRVGVVPADSVEAPFQGKYLASAAGKFLLCQPVEGNVCGSVATNAFLFQCKLRASSAKTIRIGVVQWSGTVDALPATYVSSWNANSTDPTLASSLAFLTPASASNATVSGNGVSCSVGTTYNQFAALFAAPGSSGNFLPAVWTDSAFSTNDYLEVTECGLFEGSAVQAWYPRHAQEELALCQRYFEKSNPPDLPPGDTTLLCWFNGAAAGSDYLAYSGPYKVSKRASPSLQTYDLAGTPGKITTVANGSGSNGATPTGVVSNSEHVKVYFSASGLSVAGITFNYAASAEL